MENGKILSLAISYKRFIYVENLNVMIRRVSSKRIPYGMMNFVSNREDDCYYVDNGLTVFSIFVHTVLERA